MIRKCFLVLAGFILVSQISFSQCCSTGSPVGATIYLGILSKNNFRTVLFYRNSYSDTYYQGTHKTDDNVALKFSYYNFGGISLSYGITKRLTVETDLGYFFNKTQEFNNIDFKETGYGLSNGGVAMKYGVFVRPISQIELTIGAGFRYPFTTQPQEIDGVLLNRDVQPSTNAYGLNCLLFFNKGFQGVGMRLFTVNRFEYNFADKLNYQYGSTLLNSVFVFKMIVKYFFALLQIRSEYRWPDMDENGLKRENSGHYLLILSPQLSYSIVGKWNISVLYDFPVYKDYVGKQLTPKYSIAVSISRDFDFSRKKVKMTIDPNLQ